MNIDRHDYLDECLYLYLEHVPGGSITQAHIQLFQRQEFETLQKWLKTVAAYRFKMVQNGSRLQVSMIWHLP